MIFTRWVRLGGWGLAERRGIPFAPLYVTFIYSQNKRAVDYFYTYFNDRGLLEKPLYKEVRRLAGMLDDALYLDNADVRNSAAMERLCRRLYSVLALIGIIYFATKSPADPMAAQMGDGTRKRKRKKKRKTDRDSN